MESKGLLGVLGVLLIILKLAGVIKWSWWLVTMPFWFGLGLVLVVLFFGVFASALGLVFAAALKFRRMSR